ncbi:MAG: alpha/beta hydrolase [Eubacteriales bacterium]|jgi:lysophospholipase
MKVEGIDLLGEDDFTERMNTENAAWREEHVQEGDTPGFDGLSLHYYFAPHEDAKANIVIVHGFCEFWYKYQEMSWYYWQQGYNVFFYEQRGHGYSGRQTEVEDLVHVDSFKDYVEDLKCFLDQVVIPNGEGKKIFLFSHSMGGAVSALFLERYPRYFRAAVLSSPMLKFNRQGVPEAAVRVLYNHARIHHLEHEVSYGQTRFSETPDYENSCQLSPARFNYQFNARLADPKDRTSAATYGWTCAAVDMERPVLRHANRVRIPVLLFQAGNDTLVEPVAQDVFARRAGHVEFVRYASSKHEIFNATDEVRYDYFGRIFRFYNRNLKNGSIQI